MTELSQIAAMLQHLRLVLGFVAEVCQRDKPAFFVAHLARARSHIIVDTYPTVDESFTSLHRAGWSVGDLRILTAEGPRWLVTGSNGENLVKARGQTQAEAWHRACQQAEAVGMLGRTADKGIRR